MTTLTVTALQAAYLAGLVQTAQQAQTAANEALALLTLGHVPTGATLADINTDTGVLTFTDGGPDAAD